MRAFEPQNAQFAVDLFTGEPLRAASLHFVSSHKKGSNAIVDVVVDGSIRLQPRAIAERRPLSRGSDAASHPTTPLVSYQVHRQLPGWNPPPLATRAFGAH